MSLFADVAQAGGFHLLPVELKIVPIPNNNTSATHQAKKPSPARKSENAATVEDNSNPYVQGLTLPQRTTSPRRGKDAMPEVLPRITPYGFGKED